jgi:Carboxypeptidase regulatory-like domain
MRRWGIACRACAVFAVGDAAFAQAPAGDVSASMRDATAEPPVAVIGYGALPGGIHAPSALTLGKGTFAFASLGGFGWRSGLLPAAGDDEHRFGRGIGNLAFAYAPTDMVMIALALDGRYDRHFGVPPTADGGTEDGYVGDPHVLVRAAKPLGALALGAQLGIWVPGKDAPSVAGSAISGELRALVAVKAGPGAFSFNAGFRLDNSAESVEEPAMLSLADRVSLGVSDYNAVVGGAHFTMPAGKAFFGAEASLDLFIGDGAPGPIIRGAAHAGVHLTKNWSASVFVEVAKVPGIDAADVAMNVVPLIPYEPMVTGGIGIQARFGGHRKTDDHISINANPSDVTVIEYAEVSGTVTDEAGKPVVGAKVSVKLQKITGTGITDDKGNFLVERLAIGKTVKGTTELDDTAAEVTIEVDGKKPAQQTLSLAKGRNTLAKLALEPMLPPGQLKAVVRAAASGKPIANAVVTIGSVGVTATSAADGSLSIDLPPGNYKATATAQGFQEQTLDVVIDANGVALKNFELRK